MSRIDRYVPGQFSWVDLLTPDPAASGRFYRELFGWELVEFSEQNYAQFLCRDLPVAGMGGMSGALQRSGTPPMWNSYVTV